MQDKTTPAPVSDEQALRDFLLDVDCLERLSKWTNRFNVFDVLKVTRTEIRHSNMLAWLLDPNENHGLNDAVIRGFVQFTASYLPDNDVFDDLLMDYRSFTIQREWRSIDILATSEEHKYALVIENKIDSGEHSDQLDRYRTTLLETFPNWKVRYIFLSPEGVAASDPDNWLPMDYSDVLHIVEAAKDGVSLHEGAEMLIDNYLEVIRRDIVNDEELTRVCSEIYAKHKRALDIIYEHRPDLNSELASIFVEWAEEKEEEGLLQLSRNNCTKTRTRFKTDFLSAYLPDNEDHPGHWNTPDQYFYEIVPGDKFHLQICMSVRKPSEDHEAKLLFLDSIFPKKARNGNTKTNCYFISKHVNTPDPIDPNVIKKRLDALFDEAMRFEETLKGAIDEQ